MLSVGMLYDASRCLPTTRSIGWRLAAYPLNGPISRAMREDCAYASPVRIEVRQAARSRPCGESYGTPRAISSAPRLAYPRPSGRNSSLFLVIFSVGYEALLTRISWAVMV